MAPNFIDNGCRRILYEFNNILSKVFRLLESDYYFFKHANCKRTIELFKKILPIKTKFPRK